MTEYYDTLTGKSKSKLILNHVAENGQSWLSEHCYQKVEWIIHSRDRYPFKGECPLLSPILPEPNTPSPHLTLPIGSMALSETM